MARAKVDLSIWRGNSETKAFRLMQDASTPLDLTGSTIVFTMVHDGGTVTKSSADASGVEVYDAADGRFRVVFSPAETRAIESGRIAKPRYEIERRIAGEQRTVIYGDVKLEGGINAD